MKKANPKLSWLRILLIFSQILLTGFVIQWLSYQYRDQRILLAEELERQYFESQQQVLDSLLLNKVVNPALKIRREILHDSADATNAVVTIAMSDTVRSLPEEPSDIRMIQIKKRDVLMRSVKLFIAHASDTLPHSIGVTGYYPGKPDTLLFKTVFTGRIQEKGLPDNVFWVADSAPMTHFKGNRIIINAGPTDDEFPGVSITRFNGHILREMTNQILFSLVLLLLTASAFIITFRSFKKQLILNSLRNEFVGNISHELKTPVSTVKLVLEQLNQPDKINDPERRADYLGMALKEMLRLENLVARVMDQALLEEKAAPLKKEPLEINDLINEVIQTLEPRVRNEKAVLDFEGDPSAGSISGDRLYLGSVLFNLIDNSLKYAGPEPVIRITSKGTGTHTEIMVCDNGPGIPSQYRHKIFDKFFRLPAHDTHKVKGYGLGLTFCRQVMEQHGGSIRLDSKDTGCCFILQFPINR